MISCYQLIGINVIMVISDLEIALVSVSWMTWIFISKIIMLPSSEVLLSLNIFSLVFVYFLWTQHYSESWSVIHMYTVNVITTKLFQINAPRWKMKESVLAMFPDSTLIRRLRDVSCSPMEDVEATQIISWLRKVVSEHVVDPVELLFTPSSYTVTFQLLINCQQFEINFRWFQAPETDLQSSDQSRKLSGEIAKILLWQQWWDV